MKRVALPRRPPLYSYSSESRWTNCTPVCLTQSAAAMMPALIALSVYQRSGGQWITVEAPLDQIPLFLRGNSNLPIRETQKLSARFAQERHNPYHRFPG
jgi:hypothetical protein